MNQPTRDEVEAFIAALNYGMKVTHKPEFLIALAEGWLENQKPKITSHCDHEWVDTKRSPHTWEQFCNKCRCSRQVY